MFQFARLLDEEYGITRETTRDSSEVGSTSAWWKAPICARCWNLFCRVGYMRSQMGFSGAFGRLFFSCALGCQKPDEAYSHQIQHALGLDPFELMLWDDSQANVDSARACGWNTERYEGSFQRSADS